MSGGCQCGNDMPGMCPGPAACPMCEPLDDDEEDFDLDDDTGKFHDEEPWPA